MIYAQNKDAAVYRGLHPLLDRALGLLTPEALAAFGNETAELEGRRLYVLHNFFDTAPDERRFFEAHRRYLDVHVVVKGTERLEIAETARLTQDATRSKPENDFYAFTDAEGDFQSVVLRPGSFLVVFPEDAHRCQGQVDGPCAVEKLVFKVCLD